MKRMQTKRTLAYLPLAEGGGASSTVHAGPSPAVPPLAAGEHSLAQPKQTVHVCVCHSPSNYTLCVYPGPF